ncbi:MAG: hypothetical protein KA236_06625, partial [Verrucomicrobia bacterium]|nr:hypothetical protein [Verrucomicrobiota bacterium]
VAIRGHSGQSYIASPAYCDKERQKYSLFLDFFSFFDFSNRLLVGPQLHPAGGGRVIWGVSGERRGRNNGTLFQQFDLLDQDFLAPSLRRMLTGRKTWK